MTPAFRFRIWVVVVVALVVVPHAWFAGPAWVAGWNAGGAVLVTGLLLATAWLIVTTPPSAIRLPPWRSVGVLSALTALLYAHAFVRFDLSPVDMAARVVSIAAAFGFAWLSVRRRVTPWWLAVVSWNPIMVGPYAVSPSASALIIVAAAGMLALWPRPGELTR